MNTVSPKETEPAEILPENPMTLVIETVSNPEIVQVAHDVELVGNLNTAQRLNDESALNAHNAAEHIVLQVKHEDAAITSGAGAENAKTDQAYYAQAGKSEQHDIIAQDHHVQATSDATRSAEQSQKSSALEQVSRIQVAAVEQQERISIAVTEENNITAEATKQEMKKVAAIADEENAGAADQNREAELKAAAAEASVPRLA